MSWLLGNRYKQDFQQYVPPAAGGDGGSDGTGDKPPGKAGASDAYRFDSSALERAAAAARELEKSCNYPIIFCKYFFNKFL